MEDLCEVTFALGNPRKKPGNVKKPRKSSNLRSQGEKLEHNTTKRERPEERATEDNEVGESWLRPSPAEQAEKLVPS